jgi:urease accessory protein
VLTAVAFDDDAFLATLQLADSAFPSGAYTLSHGLETLIADGIVGDPATIGRALRSALLGRVGPGDLTALLAAHRATVPELDLDTVVAIDRRLYATKLAAEDRTGSCRVGRRISVEAARLTSSAFVMSYCAAIERGDTPGCAAVAFGLVAAASGVPGRQAALAFAASFATAFLAAAVRLGRIGHGDVQRLLREARPSLVTAVDRAEATDWRALRPCAPQLDIAVARHEIAAGRLFGS